MWDTQHAVLFSQSLCMNASELKLTLPWNDRLWEAETSEDFYDVYETENAQPSYLSVLKEYITPKQGHPTPQLNALSRVLMLHGLMSVAWDLNRRDQTSLGKFFFDVIFHIANLGKDFPLLVNKLPGKRLSPDHTMLGKQNLMLMHPPSSLLIPLALPHMHPSRGL